MFGVCFQVFHDIAMIHPGRNETEAWRKQLFAHSEKWKHIRMVELSPNNCLVTKFLHWLEPCLVQNDIYDLTLKSFSLS